VKKRQTPGEFELIARYFAPLAAGFPGALGLMDDAALIDPAPGTRLVATADALVSGVHFLPEDPPDLVARKLLRVNLSDLAAMGAEPVAYLLTAVLDDGVDADWLEAFAAGLAADQAEFGIALAGGDVVRTPGPLVLTVTALGQVETGRELRRGGARTGDVVLVSGTIGDGSLGLALLRGEIAAPDEAVAAHLIERYRLPQPRLALGRRLAGRATAAIDVSDGLVADLGHICEASGLGAEIEAARIPLSAAARAVVEARPALMVGVLTGGDDYELLVAAPPAAAAELAPLAAELGLALTPIGHVIAGEGVRVLAADGAEIRLARAGYRHI